jgi:uncharacterized protein (TIGR02466 family)
MTMNLDHWFPSVIGRSHHPEWLNMTRRLIGNIFNNSSSTTNQSFYHNGRTTYGLKNLVNDPEFHPFTNWVTQQAKDFLSLQGYNADAVNWRPYFFANSFLEGSNHPKHLHTQCSVSGIYYIDIPPGSSNIVFYPNQPFKDFFDYMFSIKDANNWYSLQKTEYTPYPGLLLMWPAWLYHEVPPNKSTEPRTSIVFNL